MFTGGDFSGSIADYQRSGATKTVTVKEEGRKNKKEDTGKRQTTAQNKKCVVQIKSRNKDSEEIQRGMGLI